MINKEAKKRRGLLQGARAYLSGPMDFVASRADEKKHGWRNRVSEFLRHYGVIVFDPWNKPDVRDLHEYGREDVDTTRTREHWIFEDSLNGARARAHCSGTFWETMHIDLRMVDTSDFTIAYCPINIYSVGTVHEIVLCRHQRKPVLFVSPQVVLPTLTGLREHLQGDAEGTALLNQLVLETPIKENPRGIPSLWYMTLINSESFFDGFGFVYYRKQFGWEKIPLDDLEDSMELKRPLLPFLEKLNQHLPKKWNNQRQRYVRNDDWLLWDLRRKKDGGTEVSQARMRKRTDNANHRPMKKPPKTAAKG